MFDSSRTCPQRDSPTHERIRCGATMLSITSGISLATNSKASAPPHSVFRHSAPPQVFLQEMPVQTARTHALAAGTASPSTGIANADPFVHDRQNSPRREFDSVASDSRPTRRCDRSAVSVERLSRIDSLLVCIEDVRQLPHWSLEAAGHPIAFAVSNCGFRREKRVQTSDTPQITTRDRVYPFCLMRSSPDK
jgi:hypothetical protein